MLATQFNSVKFILTEPYFALKLDSGILALVCSFPL